MKHRADILKELGRIREEDKEMMKNVIKTMQALIESEEINDDVLNQVEACEDDLRNMKSRLVRRILELHKKGVILE